MSKYAHKSDINKIIREENLSGKKCPKCNNYLITEWEDSTVIERCIECSYKKDILDKILEVLGKPFLNKKKNESGYTKISIPDVKPYINIEQIHPYKYHINIERKHERNPDENLDEKIDEIEKKVTRLHGKG